MFFDGTDLIKAKVLEVDRRLGTKVQILGTNERLWLHQEDLRGFTEYLDDTVGFDFKPPDGGGKTPEVGEVVILEGYSGQDGKFSAGGFFWGPLRPYQKMTLAVAKRLDLPCKLSPLDSTLTQVIEGSAIRIQKSREYRKKGYNTLHVLIDEKWCE